MKIAVLRGWPKVKSVMAKHAEDHPSEAREHILDVATEQFLASGFEDTSTSSIATEAKVSKRELYRHFPDKQSILHAVVARLQEQIAAEMSQEWSSDGDVREVLLQAGMKIHRNLTSRRFRQLFRIVAAESFRTPDVAKAFYQLGPGFGRKHTGKWLSQQTKAGVLRADDPLRAADVFLDLVIGARTMTASALGLPEAVPQTKRHVEQAVDLFLQLYGTKAAGKKKRG